MVTMIDRNRLREEEELAVGPLLARAKLFRVRQQWEEAIAACTDVLRRYPASVTACSLLAEIYEAQGRLEDAAQWYAMSLERDPYNKTDRAGWERVLAAQRAQQPQPDPVKTQEPTLLPVAEKTLDWLDRFFPPGDSRSIARMLYAVSAVIAALLVVAWAIFYLFFQNETKKGVRELPPLSSLQAMATPVVVEAPHPRVSAPVKPKEATPSVAAVASPTAPPLNAIDRRLMDEIYRDSNHVFAIQSLVRDVDKGLAKLELLVPTGETIEKSRDLVLRAVAFTAQRIGQSDSTMQSVTATVLVPDAANPNNSIQVFSGDISIAPLREVNIEQVAYGDLLSHFMRLQWEGDLVSPTGNDSGTGDPGNANNASPAVPGT